MAKLDRYTITYDKAVRLSKLSGMLHGWGKYTASEWEKITGVSPLEFPGLINYSNSGLCMWTKEAEVIMNMYHAMVARNWNSLGIKA